MMLRCGWVIVLSVNLILLSGGCKARKTAAVSTPAPVAEQKPASGDSLYRQILLNDAAVEWFAAKVSASTEVDKDSKTFTANLRIRKDSAIWLSISPALGIEVARVLITKDSLKFINRLEGTYFKGGYSYLNELLQIDVNFSMVQSILLGNCYLHHPVEKYTAVTEEGDFILSTLNKRKIKRESELEIPEILTQEIWFSSVVKKIVKMEMQDYRPVRRFAVKYKSHEQVESWMVPNALEIEANARKEVRIQLDYSRITVNKVLNIPFSIPENYESIR